MLVTSLSLDPASRTYLRHFTPTMLAYVALVFVAPTLIDALHARGALLWAIAVLPALPIMAVFVWIGRYWIELGDEYLRLLEVRKALVATGATLSVAAAWGFLEIYAHAAHLPTFYIPVIWFGGLGLGACVNTLSAPRMTA